MAEDSAESSGSWTAARGFAPPPPSHPSTFPIAPHSACGGGGGSEAPAARSSGPAAKEEAGGDGRSVRRPGGMVLPPGLASTSSCKPFFCPC